MSSDVFRPTKGNPEYPMDEYESHEFLDNGNSDSRLDYEKSFFEKGKSDFLIGKVPSVKDDASRNKMFDILEREERKRGRSDANKEKEKEKELKSKKIAANGCHHAILDRDNVTQLQDCGPQVRNAIFEKLVGLLSANMADLNPPSEDIESLAAEEEYKIFKASNLKNTYYNKYKAKMKEIETCTFQKHIYTSDDVIPFTFKSTTTIKTTSTTNTTSNTTSTTNTTNTANTTNNTTTNTTTNPRPMWTSAKSLLPSNNKPIVIDDDELEEDDTPAQTTKKLKPSLSSSSLSSSSSSLSSTSSFVSAKSLTNKFSSNPNQDISKMFTKASSSLSSSSSSSSCSSFSTASKILSSNTTPKFVYPTKLSSSSNFSKPPSSSSTNNMLNITPKQKLVNNNASNSSFSISSKPPVSSSTTVSANSSNSNNNSTPMFFSEEWADML